MRMRYLTKTVPLHTMPWAFILHPGATQTSGLLAFYFKTVRFAHQAHRATLDAFHAAENGPNLVDGELQAQKEIQCPTTSAHWLHKWERGWCHWRHGRAPKFKPCSCFPFWRIDIFELDLRPECSAQGACDTAHKQIGLGQGHHQGRRVLCYCINMHGCVTLAFREYDSFDLEGMPGK